MPRMRIAPVFIALLTSAFLAVGSCGKSGGASSPDAGPKIDAHAGSGGRTGGISGTGGAPATGGILGMGGSRNVCAGKAANCRPFPEGCKGDACTSCPCEGGVGGVLGSGGVATGGVSGGGGTTGRDAASIDSCFDDQGAIKAAMKACSTAGDCRQDRDIYCCGSDHVVGLASTARCQLSNPDCSNRGCMKWTYFTLEDGTTTEHGGAIAVACLAGRCSTYLVVASSLDGSVSETPLVDAPGRF